MIIFLEPVLKEYVWGGRRLITELPYRGEGEHIGECWTVSAHPHGDCVVAAGEYAGKTLSELYREHRELFGNIEAEEFPLLVKIIDAKTDLSIQVHPDDAYARQHEGVPFGKAEFWYVMDCPREEDLIIGHNAETRKELVDLVGQNRYEELIRHVPVKKDDCLQIAPGTLHGIKSGYLILEVQQNCDITYRVYDYERLVNGKPRPLHVQQCLDVVNVPDETNKLGLKHTQSLPKNQLNQLIDCQYYRVWKIKLDRVFVMEQVYPFLIVSVLEGEGTIDGHPVERGSNLLFTSGHGTVTLEGDMLIVFSTVGSERD